MRGKLWILYILVVTLILNSIIVPVYAGTDYTSIPKVVLNKFDKWIGPDAFTIRASIVQNIKGINNQNGWQFVNKVFDVEPGQFKLTAKGYPDIPCYIDTYDWQPPSASIHFQVQGNMIAGVNYSLVVLDQPKFWAVTNGVTVKKNFTSENLIYSVKHKSKFTLPAKVKVKTGANTYKEVTVNWGKTQADTSKIGTFKNSGIVKGYSEKVILTLNVEPIIVSVNNLSLEIDQRDFLQLPNTIAAITSTGTKVNVPVVWDSKKIDTSIPGKYELVGTIKDYTPKVKLNLEIKAIPKEEKTKQDLEQIKSKVKIIRDIRLFTLYAFLNYTGKNNTNDYSKKYRDMLMADLNAMSLKFSNNTYHLDKEKEGLPFHMYIYLLRYNIGNPPNFSFVDSNYSNYESNGKLSDMPKLLNEFYVKANVENLYKKYAPYFNIEEKRLADNAYPAYMFLNDYYKINAKDMKEFDLQVILFNNEAFSFDQKDVITGRVGNVVKVDDDTNMKLTSAHEYAHLLTSEIIFTNFITNDAVLSRVSKDGPAKDITNYGMLVSESYARAVSAKVLPLDQQAAYVNGEMKNGYILTKYFYDRFEEFYSFNGTIEEFLKKIVAEYK